MDTAELSAPETRRNAQPCFRLAKNSVFAADPDITAERQLVPATQSIAIDCSNDRDRKGLNFSEQSVSCFTENTGFAFAHTDHFCHIRASNKGFLPPACDNQAADVLQIHRIQSFI